MGRSKSFTLLALLILSLAAFCLVLGVVSKGQAFADSPSPAEYILRPNQLRESYYNGVNGCTYTVPIGKSLASALANELVRIEYSIVEYTDPTGTDLVTLDEDGTITSEHEILTWDNVKQEHLPVTLGQPDTQTQNHWQEFKVTAYEWCAIIFYVYFKPTAADEEQLSVESPVVVCVNIDHGKPTAYLYDYAYIEGVDHFTVMIRSNSLSVKNSADSGIKRFQIFKRVGNTETKVIEPIALSGRTSYPYTFAVTERAEYYVLVEDNVGNQSKTLVLKFTSDSAFESAVQNVLDELKRKENYHKSIAEGIAEAYYQYLSLYQNADATAEELEAAKETVRAKLRAYNELKELEKKGRKEWTLVLVNEEYLSGAIEILNFERAHGSLLYGEKAMLTLTFAEFDPNRVDKSAVIKKAGLSSAQSVLAVTVSLIGDQSSGYLKEKFSVPLQIKIPTGSYKSVKAVLAKDTEQGSELSLLAMDEYKGYVVVYLTDSYGTVNLLLGGASNLLWLLTLLVIPVGGGIAVVIIFLKKKKAGKNEEEPPTAEAVKAEDEKEKKASKNKSRKGN